jgi:glucosamine-6-phosphate deaminase
MDVIILPDSEAVAAEGARRVRDLLATKADAVLGLATGATPLAMYRRLVADCEQGTVSFAKVTTFNLDEYVGLRANNPQSYRAYMERELFGRIDIDRSRTHLPACEPGADPEAVGPRYEALIVKAGGIDLQVLGIGANGHIGFNEPTSSLSSRTRVKTLSRETLDSNRRYFDDPAEQPQIAITMGIGTIRDARNILLLATGTRKADAVRQLVEGPVSAMWPATALQLHEKVTVLCDEDAASDLELRDYYRWVNEQRLRLQAESGGVAT